MTLTKLLSDYQTAGGSLTGEPLYQAADAVWALLLGESRGRILEADDIGPEAQLIAQCFRHLVEYAAGGEELQSETLGQWTKTYRSGDKNRDKTMLSILRQYLGETGLLYRGWPG